MNKKDRLKKIEEQYELFIIDCFDADQTERLPEVASIGSYLAKNQMVAEREKSTVEEEIKKRIKKSGREKNI